MKHLIVDRDTSDHGLWHMGAQETEASARIFARKNANGDTTPYYRYMDTATSSLAPFKPELIEELVHVTDNEPMNPLVCMNKGHLLAQLTFFIGPVNFYCTVRGERQCKPMNTGDSCLITSYVPHSFTSRDPSQYAAIVAVTFSGNVRDALGDLVHHDIAQVIAHAGNRREPATVFARRVDRFAELRGATKEELAAALTAPPHGCAADAVARTLGGKGIDPGVVAALAAHLNVPASEFECPELEAWEEVTYAKTPEDASEAESKMYAFASCKHTPDCGGYEWYLKGTETRTSQFFNYVYNHSQVPVVVAWAGQRRTLAPGDSCVLKPFVEVTYSSPSSKLAKLVVVKVPGCVNNGVMKECSTFANEGLQRMSGNTTKWW